MSSRFTAPVSKLTRYISTSSSVAAPSHILVNGSKAAAARSNRQTAVKVESEESTSEYSTFTSPNRPFLPSSNQPQLSFRFMQTFHHSAPRARPAPTQTVDHLVLPSFSAAESSTQSDYIRVPLLPDTSFPSSSVLKPESTDAPLPKPEILVIAANPEQVLPAALTEVEGMGVDGVELKFAHQNDAVSKEESWEVSGGMIRDLWRGLVDDVMGSEGSKKPAL
ncbi:hypothetical protein QBC44DRAFT_281740 [Cladorrhinum sp. PSN332]|nr:hypothetical protein QBC44DRAFT_281740 [Cladorrhinum sp. PSN332]